MRLLCSIVTHNRLEYTQRTIESWNETRQLGDTLVIVDNASTDDTRGWLARARPGILVLNRRNLFPGAATNLGWHAGLQKDPNVDLLMRLDNDIQLLPGWREEVTKAFTAVPELAIFGLLNRHEDYDNEQPVTLDETGTVNVHWDQVGGNCVVPRTVWDHGLRWKPGAWQPGGLDEDSFFAAEIRRLGGLVGTAVPTVANNMSFHRYNDFPEYYNQTAALRGLVPQLSV